MFAGLLAAFFRRRAQDIAVETLHRYDDHRLRDLGISRDQIESFVAGRL